MARLLKSWSRFRSTTFLCQLYGASERRRHEDTQPFVRIFADRQLSLSHNGYLTKSFATELPLGRDPGVRAARPHRLGAPPVLAAQPAALDGAAAPARSRLGDVSTSGCREVDRPGHAQPAAHRRRLPGRLSGRRRAQPSPRAGAQAAARGRRGATRTTSCVSLLRGRSALDAPDVGLDLQRRAPRAVGGDGTGGECGAAEPKA